MKDKIKIILSGIIMAFSFVMLVSALVLQEGQVFTQGGLDGINIDSISYQDLQPTISRAGIGKSNGILVVGVLVSHLDIQPQDNNYIIIKKTEVLPIMTYRDYLTCVSNERSKTNCINNVIKPLIVQRLKNSMDSSLLKARSYQNQVITTTFDEGDITLGVGDFT